MRFILASISLGFFSWASYMVLTGRFTGDEDGSSKSRALMAVIEQSSETLGVPETALALLSLGAVLSFGIIAFGPQDDA